MSAPFSVREVATAAELAAYNALRYEVLRKPWNQPHRGDSDENESRHFAAFLPDGSVVGAGRVLFPEPGKAQIRSMATHPDWRRKGVARALVTALENAALANAARVVILHARENAVSFYQACGYHVVAPSYVLFGEIPHFLMQRALQEGV